MWPINIQIKLNCYTLQQQTHTIHVCISCIQLRRWSL